MSNLEKFYAIAILTHELGKCNTFFFSSCTPINILSISISRFAVKNFYYNYVLTVLKVH